MLWSVEELKVVEFKVYCGRVKYTLWKSQKNTVEECIVEELTAYCGGVNIV